MTSRFRPIGPLVLSKIALWITLSYFWAQPLAATDNPFSKEVQLLCRGSLQTNHIGTTQSTSAKEDIVFGVSFRSRPDQNAKGLGIKGFDEIQLTTDGSLLIIKDAGSFTTCSGYSDSITCERNRQSRVTGNDPSLKGTMLENRDSEIEEKQHIAVNRKTGLFSYDMEVKVRYSNPTEIKGAKYSGKFECAPASARRF